MRFRELVYALYVVDALPERIVFSLWLILDVGIVRAVLKFGPGEWSSSPFIANHLLSIFVLLTTFLTLGQLAFASWWITNDISSSTMAGRKGVIYAGREYGPDSTELGFWSSATAQLYLSGACLAQLLSRGDSRGSGWGSFVARMMGSVFGLYVNFGVVWWWWTEAHGYFMSPLGVWLWGGSLVLDIMYGWTLWTVKRREKDPRNDVKKVE